MLCRGQCCERLLLDVHIVVLSRGPQPVALCNRAVAEGHQGRHELTITRLMRAGREQGRRGCCCSGLHRAGGLPACTQQHAQPAGIRVHAAAGGHDQGSTGSCWQLQHGEPSLHGCNLHLDSESSHFKYCRVSHKAVTCSAWSNLNPHTVLPKACQPATCGQPVMSSWWWASSQNVMSSWPQHQQYTICHPCNRVAHHKVNNHVHGQPACASPPPSRAWGRSTTADQRMQGRATVAWQSVAAHAMGPAQVLLHLRRALDDPAAAVVRAAAAALVVCVRGQGSEQAHALASLCPQTGAVLLSPRNWHCVGLQVEGVPLCEGGGHAEADKMQPAQAGQECERARAAWGWMGRSSGGWLLECKAGGHRPPAVTRVVWSIRHKLPNGHRVKAMPLCLRGRVRQVLGRMQGSPACRTVPCSAHMLAPAGRWCLSAPRSPAAPWTACCLARSLRL